jgi:RND family efflux transporter MFP subunit
MRLLRHILILLALAAAAAGGWHFWRTRPPVVEVAEAVRGPAVEAVYATGTVEPVRWAAVAPAVKARLEAVLADDGDRVAAGQILAHLDDTVAAAQVAEVEARARFAAEEAQRLELLMDKGAAPRSDVDRARSEARALAAAAEAARRRLDDFDLEAPIDGIVLRRDGEPGEMVDTSEPVFWVGEPRPLRITADVDEEDIPRVRPGMKALLKADAYPERVFEGRLAAITPKGDPVQKTYRVRLELPLDTPLMIGMTIEANIVVREAEDAVLVPATAVRDGAVFVVDGERARQRAVEVGVVGPRLAEIRAELAPGERVIVDPPASLADGRRVRVRPERQGQGGGAAPPTGAVAAQE